MADLIEVTLSSPTKVDLRVLMAGVQSVSAEELQHLREAGVVVTAEPVTEGNVVAANAGTVFDQAAFDAAVAAQAQLLAGQAFDGALAQAVREAKANAAEAKAMAMEKDAALAQAKDAAALAADLAEKLTAVTAELDALKAAQTTTQNTTVAKTTAKKGAATS